MWRMHSFRIYHCLDKCYPHIFTLLASQFKAETSSKVLSSLCMTQNQHKNALKSTTERKESGFPLQSTVVRVKIMENTG